MGILLPETHGLCRVVAASNIAKPLQLLANEVTFRIRTRVHGISSLGWYGCQMWADKVLVIKG